MNLRKIMALDKKAAKEAQKEVDKIYKKYNNEMIELIANQVPKGCVLHSGNGMCYISDSNGNEILNGRAWGMTFRNQDNQLNRLSALQYNEPIDGCWSLDFTIKGKKV